VVSEVVRTKVGIVVIRRVVHIILVSGGVGVSVDCVICIKREQKAIPRSVFLLVFVLRISERLVMGFVGSSLSHVHFFLSYHSLEWLQIRSRVPRISLLSPIGSSIGENNTYSECSQHE